MPNAAAPFVKSRRSISGCLVSLAAMRLSGRLAPKPSVSGMDTDRNCLPAASSAPAERAGRGSLPSAGLFDRAPVGVQLAVKHCPPPRRRALLGNAVRDRTVIRF